MTGQHYLLRDVAKRLGVKPYQVAYALSVGLVEEPELRISNKRIFRAKDIERLAKHFGVEPGRSGGNTHDER